MSETVTKPDSWLANYPSTNARLFASVCLDVVFVLTALFCMVRKVDVDTNIIWTIGTFLLVLSGLDATQFTVKRKTEIITPPQTTAENAVSPVGPARSPGVDESRAIRVEQPSVAALRDTVRKEMPSVPLATADF